MTDEDREHLEAMLTALLAAYDELDEDARTAGSDVEAIKRATRLLDAVRDRTDLTSRWRARFTLRLRRTEDLSLQKLADRIGLKKERTAQIVKLAEKHEAEKGGAPGAS